MKYALPLTLAMATAAIATPAAAVDVRGFAGIESRLFFENPAYTGQQDNSASVVFNPELRFPVGEGYDDITFEYFTRIDGADEERTHVDIRQLRYLKVGDGWEARLGIGKVFWGVTEGQHLVDIVNQTDAVENLDGEDKLGQPMINVTLLKYMDYGIFDFFVLPGFRERTFVGEEGRLRTGLVVDTDDASYEDGEEEKHVDYALRWSHTIDVFDIGLSHFYGTSRDPVLNGADFVLGPSGPVPTKLVPFYPIINQTGLDLQASLEGWLLKLEVISRDGINRVDPTNGLFIDDRYTALAGGFEYTIVDFLETGIDLGLIAEWNHDDRDKEATTTFQDDVLVGTRWAFNDAESSEILAGFVQDLDYSTTTASLEASTRLSDHLKLTVEGRAFIEVDDEDIVVKQLESDGFIQTQLDYYF